MIHHRVAAGILKSMQERAQVRGLSLDIGDLSTDNTDTTVANDDPERIERLTAHLVARVADRFAVLRRFSRHMEGTEKRAGLLSDAFAALWALYERNPETFEQAGKAYAREIAARQHARREVKKAEKAATQTSPVNSDQPTQHTGGIFNATP